jgi:hypothetical protein
MKNILVFCAGNVKARANYNATVLHPIPRDTVLSSFPPEKGEKLRELEARAGGFFAWGIGTTKRASFAWERLSVGDLLLGFFEFHYRAVAHLAAKEESPGLAELLWASRDRPRILFLTAPLFISIPASALCPPLCSSYRGTTRISDERTAQIVADYGSIHSFEARELRANIPRDEPRPARQ